MQWLNHVWSLLIEHPREWRLVWIGIVVFMGIFCLLLLRPARRGNRDASDAIDVCAGFFTPLAIAFIISLSIAEAVHLV
jgi:hypothetical protein